MTVLSTAAFKFCAPPEEYFDYPLYFPKPNFPGRVASSVKDDEEFEQQMEQRRIEEEAIRAAANPHLYKKMFDQFSKGKPTIDSQKAGDLSRAIGFAPSQADIAALHAQFKDVVTFDDFQRWQSERCFPHKANDKTPRLESVFKDLDFQGSGLLTRQQIRTLLGNYGEALTDEEMDVIFNELGVKGDRVDYREFVKRLLHDFPDN